MSSMIAFGITIIILSAVAFCSIVDLVKRNLDIKEKKIDLEYRIKEMEIKYRKEEL